MRRLLLTLAALCAAALVSGCGGSDSVDTSESSTSSSSTGSSDSAEASGSSEQKFPDVKKAELTRDSGGSYTVDVTVSSPYDAADRYADGWRVLGADDTALGSHELGHDHASEQPFTRTQSGLEIPDEVAEVTVEGHDQANGFGGDTVTVKVPGR